MARYSFVVRISNQRLYASITPHPPFADKLSLPTVTMAAGAPGASAAATEPSDTITIDLRKTTATAMLQSTPFSRTLDIADILELKPMQRSSATHVHATEQDLPIQHDQHEADLTATTAEKGLAQFPTMREMQSRGTLHAHENAPGISTTYRLLLYWACSRVVARVHLATVPQRRACRGLRATWTLQCMTQLCRYDLPACRGCGFYPTSATCSNCCTAWCHSCRAWSALCWKCYRPQHSLADTGEFMPGFGGPGGNGSFDTPL
mgnify:CR=1 FL=1